MKTVWRIIETSPETAAALSWRRWLGPSFDAVAAVCLRGTKRSADRIPCENGCGCNHRVCKRGAGYAGVCDCGDDCDEIPLTAADIKVWELNLDSLGRAVTKALGCSTMLAPIGFHRTIQVTALGNPALPVVLVVQPDAQSYRNAVAHLLARLPKGFILLTPTKLGDASTLELLNKASVGFYDLESHLTLLPSGKLHSPKTAEVLFAAHLPEKKEAFKESETQRVFRLFRELMSLGTHLKASPGQVFELMVFKGHKQNEAARLCKCVPSLITRRVTVIENHFDMTIEKLRDFATVLTDMNNSVKGQRYAKKKHGAPADEPSQYGEADKQDAKEDAGGYLP